MSGTQDSHGHEFCYKLLPLVLREIRVGLPSHRFLLWLMVVFLPVRNTLASESAISKPELTFLSWNG